MFMRQTASNLCLVVATDRTLDAVVKCCTVVGEAAFLLGEEAEAWPSIGNTLWRV